MCTNEYLLWTITVVENEIRLDWSFHGALVVIGAISVLLWLWLQYVMHNHRMGSKKTNNNINNNYYN